MLDGQQRLVAIRDFVNNEFPVDGNTDPSEASIEALDGLYYKDLSEDWKRRFNQFTIRLFRIVDYRGGEPGELFFRLNQPSSLTAAEQRNAFFGPVRQQIKSVVESLAAEGLDKEVFGFSNWRMAYDDVLSRTALAVERGSIGMKIAASDLIELYRSDKPLSSTTVSITLSAVNLLAQARGVSHQWPKFNKATLFSWLMFLIRPVVRQRNFLPPTEVAEFISFFDESRRKTLTDPDWRDRANSFGISASRLFSIYENRAAARVADVSSVVLRDGVLWLAFDEYTRSKYGHACLPFIDIEAVRISFDSSETTPDEELIAHNLLDLGWGKLA